MRAKFRRVITFLFLQAVASFSLLPGALNMVASPAALTVTLHEPVTVDITIANAGSLTTKVDLGRNFEGEYRVHLVRPDGVQTEAGPLGWPEGMGTPGRITLGAGEQYTGTLLLSSLVKFDSPGEYLLSISVPGIQDEAQVQVIVEPRDATRLRARCEQLASKVMAGYETWDLSIRSLASVDDDEAVPFLLAVTKADPFQPTAVEGLARIGTMPAVLAVETVMAEAKEPIMFLVARSRLMTVRGSTNDAAVRKEVERALASSEKRAVELNAQVRSREHE